MPIDYHGRVFRPLSNNANGEVEASTRFVYTQEGDLLTGTYRGAAIVSGQLLGTVNPDGSLDFLYHHRNAAGELMAGRCHSVPDRDEQGRLLLRESWQWTTGDGSSGHSVLVEA